MSISRINALRELMAERGLDAYIVLSSDYHASEYLGDHFKCRAYISGFTGSAGTLVVTQDDAGLWTDGRYFIQAAHQLEGSGITLYRMGEPGVPGVTEYLRSLSDGACIGMDGRTVSALFGRELKEALADKHMRFTVNIDLAGEVWEDRPPMPDAKAYLLDIKYAGKSCADKLSELRTHMQKKNADIHVLTTLDDIAWLFNLRGGDVLYNPVLLAYAIIERKHAYLFTDAKKLSADLSDSLKANGVTVMPYAHIYEFITHYADNTRVLAYSRRVNNALWSLMEPRMVMIDEENPTVLAKSMKNDIELENLRRAHIKDGVALTKFIYWLKTNIGKTHITEISASDVLFELRRAQEGNLGLSFDTIAAYSSNGAMCHYSATDESNAAVEPRGFLLVDSGGQYYEGTTDVTRTIAVGPLTDIEKHDFTLVLRSMICLARARFLHGCSGQNLDVLAREPFWAEGLDYKHGTGHGIGYLLNVHEGPNGFRWKQSPDRSESAVLEAGMVTSDEPGLYIEGSHGIRTENEIVVREGETNTYGTFMYFETLTLAPIDLDAIEPSQLSGDDIAWLNAYHARVYESLAPHMDEAEREWLKTATRAI